MRALLLLRLACRGATYVTVCASVTLPPAALRAASVKVVVPVTLRVVLPLVIGVSACPLSLRAVAFFVAHVRVTSLGPHTSCGVTVKLSIAGAAFAVTVTWGPRARLRPWLSSTRRR